MKNLTPVVSAGASALAMTSCTKGAQVAVDTSKIADTIKAQEAGWQKAYSDKDLNTLAGEYADDAVLGSPGDPLAATDVHRRKAIQSLIGDSNFKLSFASDDVRVASAGDMASSRGHYTITTTDKATSKPVTSGGAYPTVSTKKDNGGFKGIEDIMHPGPAAAAA